MPKRKVKKEKQLTKQGASISKIKLRKHLNADALFATIRQEFDKIPDSRTGKPKIQNS